MAEPVGICAGDDLLAGMFAGTGQAVVGGAAVAVRVLRRRWSRAERRRHLRYLLASGGAGWDPALPPAVPASEAVPRAQCSQWWCSQEGQQSLGMAPLPKGKSLSG